LTRPRRNGPNTHRGGAGAWRVNCSMPTPTTGRSPTGTLIVQRCINRYVMGETARRAIQDVTLANCSADLPAAVVDGVEDVTLSSTEAVCKNTHHLLDWDEYSEVAL